MLCRLGSVVEKSGSRLLPGDNGGAPDPVVLMTMR